MEKITLYLSFIFSLIFCSSFGQSDRIENKKFPIEKLHFYNSNEKLKIVVFLPITYIQGYEQMLTKSLKYYFQEGLAFNSIDKPKIDVILIVNDNKNIGFYFDFKFDTKSMFVYFDEKGLISKPFGIIQVKNLIPLPSDGKFSKDSKKLISSKVFLLDEKNNLLLKVDNYHAQGEHSKALENKIKKHLKLGVTNQIEKSKNFAVGDKASIILKEIPERLKISETLKESNWDILNDDSHIKVITFYPATFSGNDKSLKESAHKDMMCYVQIKQLDESEKRQKRFLKNMLFQAL